MMLATGLKAWVWQRLSAVYLAIFVVWFSVHLWMSPPADFQHWRQWMAQPQVASAFALFFISLMIHAWVGIRDIVMDYIHPLIWRALVLATVIFSLLGAGAWSFLVLAGIEY